MIARKGHEMNRKGVIPIRSPDPTAAEILERAAAVRAEWSAIVERKRRGAPADEGIVHWPIDPETIGLQPGWSEVAI
jgi:hypothetical protein